MSQALSNLREHQVFQPQPISRLHWRRLTSHTSMRCAASHPSKLKKLFGSVALVAMTQERFRPSA